MHSCAEDGMARRQQMKNGNGIFQTPLTAFFIAEPIALTLIVGNCRVESSQLVRTGKSTTWPS